MISAQGHQVQVQIAVILITALDQDKMPPAKVLRPLRLIPDPFSRLLLIIGENEENHSRIPLLQAADCRVIIGVRADSAVDVAFIHIISEAKVNRCTSASRHSPICRLAIGLTDSLRIRGRLLQHLLLLPGAPLLRTEKLLRESKRFPDLFFCSCKIPGTLKASAEIPFGFLQKGRVKHKIPVILLQRFSSRYLPPDSARKIHGTVRQFLQLFFAC